MAIPLATFEMGSSLGKLGEEVTWRQDYFLEVNLYYNKILNIPQETL
jgi:hypothetical protein